MFEEELAAAGARACRVHEVWCVYILPMDPRVPGPSGALHGNNKEAGFISEPRPIDEILYPADSNTCGEVPTTCTTYTGIEMRRFGELPRMEHGTKVGILGSTASGVASGRRVQTDINERGHPFSWAEARPLALWRRICADHYVTHVVDFTPGSAALAIAASGEMQYEGIASNDEHKALLDPVFGWRIRIRQKVLPEPRRRCRARGEGAPVLRRFRAGSSAIYGAIGRAHGRLLLLG